MSAPHNIEPEEGSPNSPEPAGETHGLTAPPSGSEAVRKALQAGLEGPQEGIAWVRQQFGIEISPSHFNAVKATERKKGWTKNGKPGRKPKAKATHPADDVTTPGESQGHGESDLIRSPGATRPPAASPGNEQVKRIVDLFG